jgi:hypothetical protein
MRLAGLMMIHEWSPLGCEELVIGELARHVDGVFILANKGAPESWIKAAKACPKLARFETGHETDWRGPWGVRLLDDAKPEMFVYPDSDELLPPNLEEIITLMETADGSSHHDDTTSTTKNLSAERKNSSVVPVVPVVVKPPAMCVEFPILFCAGDPDHIIASTTFCGHGPHCKLALWRPDLEGQKVAFNYPAQDYVGNAWRSPWPIRHLVTARPRDWRRRYQTKPAPWMLDAWPVEPYDPTRRWT